MPILEITTRNKYGNLRKTLIHSPTSNLGLNPKKFGSFFALRTFKYKHTHPVLPPTLFTNHKGKKFILPGWFPVLFETQYEDIDWIKPKKKQLKKVEQQTWTFKSESSDKIYKVTRNGENLRCNCFGFWRAKDREKGCKHVQEVRSKL